MIISEIKREKKHLCRLLFTDGTDALIDMDICAGYSLKSGMRLDREKLTEIIETSDYERAKSRALWYLDRSSYTEKGLYEKLCRAGFNKKACAAVTARFKELSVIDDRKFAEYYAEKCISANISRREAYQKMLLKGVPRELANEVLDSFETDENAQITELLNKKYRLKLENPDNVKKVYAALIRKGFSFSAVKEALKSYCDELYYASEE